MSVAISFESHNGSVDAFVIGSPQIRATAGNRHDAEFALTSLLREKMRAGELKWIEVNPYPTYLERAESVSEEDKAAMDEIVATIYAERDAEKAAEFPE